MNNGFEWMKELVVNVRIRQAFFSLSACAVKWEVLCCDWEHILTAHLPGDDAALLL